MTSLAEIEPLKSLQIQEVLNVPPEKVEEVEAKLLQMPQIDCPLAHKFAPGVYWREILMPRGSFIIGHQHLTEHFNVVLTGRAAVMMDGVMHHIEAPCVFPSKPGVRKVLYIIDTMRWATVHPTNTTDLKELEAELIVKSDSFKAHEEMKVLQDMVAKGALQ